MKEYDVKIFTENVEPEAVNQIYELLARPPFADKRVRVMPDVHYGTGCVVGFTAPLGDKIIPNVLGVDLGCGMLTVELGKIDIPLPALDDFIKRRIPYGSTHRKERHAEELIERLYCFRHLTELERVYGALGTLGGGNHFIEIDEDEEGCKYLIIHSGSRNLGLQVAKHYQRLAVEECKNAAKEERERVTAELSAQKRPEDIPDAIAKINAKHAHKTKIPAELCYLEGVSMERYLHDLALCQVFASENRRKMAEEILKFLRVYKYTSFETVHNFIDKDGMIRKGAIPAHEGQKVLIPMNMRDGCIIAVGKGNEDWNFSAPHGAGRLCRRSEARELFTVEEYEMEMKGIYSSTVGASTLDESPMVYKPMEEIVRLISPTVKIIKIIRPIYNFKASD